MKLGTNFKPLVSVVMPVFNRREYLQEAVESILRQTFVDFEFIIVDDFSTDGSRDLLLILREIDARIRIIFNETNLGIALTRNTGMKAANGEFIAIMDSDDVAHPSRLETQIDYLRQHPEIGFCGTWIEYFGNTPKKIWETPLTDEEIRCGMLFTMCVANPTVMLRSEIVRDFNLVHDPNFINASDYELWTRALDYTKAGNVDKVLLRYRVHSQQISHKAKINLDKTRLFVHQRSLNKLRIVFTPEDLSLHNEICENNQVKGENLIPQVETWLLKLINANEQKRLYDPKTFQNEISKRWTRFILNNSVNLNKMWSVFYSSLEPEDRKNKFGRIVFLVKWALIDFRRKIHG